jgi:ketosteroid isomerase-like protein
MLPTYATPQQAEDAFYDALDEGDLEQLLAVWADSEDICCLLPMYPLIRGRRDVTELFTRLFSRGKGVSLTVKHLGWIEAGDIAIHQVEESVENSPAGAPPSSPFYGTNIYRREASGWRLLVHQNAPTPPPPPAEFTVPD